MDNPIFRAASYPIPTPVHHVRALPYHRPPSRMNDVQSTDETLESQAPLESNSQSISSPGLQHQRSIPNIKQRLEEEQEQERIQPRNDTVSSSVVRKEDSNKSASRSPSKRALNNTTTVPQQHISFRKGPTPSFTTINKTLNHYEVKGSGKYSNPKSLASRWLFQCIHEVREQLNPLENTLKDFQKERILLNNIIREWDQFFGPDGEIYHKNILPKTALDDSFMEDDNDEKITSPLEVKHNNIVSEDRQTDRKITQFKQSNENDPTMTNSLNSPIDMKINIGIQEKENAGYRKDKSTFRNSNSPQRHTISSLAKLKDRQEVEDKDGNRSANKAFFNSPLTSPKRSKNRQAKEHGGGSPFIKTTKIRPSSPKRVGYTNETQYNKRHSSEMKSKSNSGDCYGGTLTPGAIYRLLESQNKEISKLARLLSIQKDDYDGQITNLQSALDMHALTSRSSVTQERNRLKELAELLQKERVNSVNKFNLLEQTYKEEMLNIKQARQNEIQLLREYHAKEISQMQLNHDTQMSRTLQEHEALMSKMQKSLQDIQYLNIQQNQEIENINQENEVLKGKLEQMDQLALKETLFQARGHRGQNTTEGVTEDSIQRRESVGSTFTERLKQRRDSNPGAKGKVFLPHYLGNKKRKDSSRRNSIDSINSISNTESEKDNTTSHHGLGVIDNTDAYIAYLEGKITELEAQIKVLMLANEEKAYQFDDGQNKDSAAKLIDARAKAILLAPPTPSPSPYIGSLNYESRLPPSFYRDSALTLNKKGREGKGKGPSSYLPWLEIPPRLYDMYEDGMIPTSDGHFIGKEGKIYSVSELEEMQNKHLHMIEEYSEDESNIFSHINDGSSLGDEVITVSGTGEDVRKRNRRNRKETGPPTIIEIEDDENIDNAESRINEESQECPLLKDYVYKKNGKEKIKMEKVEVKEEPLQKNVEETKAGILSNEKDEKEVVSAFTNEANSRNVNGESIQQNNKNQDVQDLKLNLFNIHEKYDAEIQDIRKQIQDYKSRLSTSIRDEIANDQNYIPMKLNIIPGGNPVGGVSLAHNNHKSPANFDERENNDTENISVGSHTINELNSITSSINQMEYGEHYGESSDNISLAEY